MNMKNLGINHNASVFISCAGVTPLMEAARSGNTAICRALVQEGRADVNIRESTSHCTAFDFAVESGRCSTPELLLLSPVAQRKLNARQHREASGHKTLKEVIENSNMHCPRSEWLKPTKLSVASKYEAYPLPTEYAQHANSMVFQVSKRLQRLSEDSEGEIKEEAEMEEERKQAPIRRRYSLPSARRCVYGGGSQQTPQEHTFPQPDSLRIPKTCPWQRHPSLAQTPVRSWDNFPVSHPFPVWTHSRRTVHGRHHHTVRKGVAFKLQAKQQLLQGAVIESNQGLDAQINPCPSFQLQCPIQEGFTRAFHRQYVLSQATYPKDFTLMGRETIKCSSVIFIQMSKRTFLNFEHSNVLPPLPLSTLWYECNLCITAFPSHCE